MQSYSLHGCCQLDDKSLQLLRLYYLSPYTPSAILTRLGGSLLQKLAHGCANCPANCPWPLPGLAASSGSGGGLILRFEKSRPGGMTFMMGKWRPRRTRARTTRSRSALYLRTRQHTMQGPMSAHPGINGDVSLEPSSKPVILTCSL
jgi:hypothetical protein